MSNKNLKTNNPDYVDWGDENFKALVRQAIFEEKEYLKDKTLMPNAYNFEKYLYVQKQLNKICKNHNTTLYEQPQTTSAFFELTAEYLETDEIKIISKIHNLCSAIEIFSLKSGGLIIYATIPNVRCVFEEEIKKIRH